MPCFLLSERWGRSEVLSSLGFACCLTCLAGLQEHPTSSIQQPLSVLGSTLIMLFLVYIVVTLMTAYAKDTNDKFYWGVATAAYQIEGAVNHGGRGPSIWDSFTSLPGTIANGDTGYMADDSYHHWREDIELIQRMGLTAYRFSISWSRILPNGNGNVNLRGIEYYNKIIDRLV